MKTLQGARETVFFHISSLPKADSAKKSKYHRLLQRDGSGEQGGGGIIKDEVSQEGMAKKSLSVVRQSHK